MVDRHPEEEAILEPDDLDYDDYDEIQKLDGRRFVVTAESDSEIPVQEIKNESDSSAGEDDTSYVEQTDDVFAIEATIKTDSDIETVKFSTNNVVDFFDAFLSKFVTIIDTRKSPDPREAFRLLISQSRFTED